MAFKLKLPYKPTGDQPQAIEKLTGGLKKDTRNQVLLGVTGSGKTFTIANVIQNLQMPTLVISHNKTLAAQLYQEFRDFFPENGISYFVSYYDYYQPEAYIPRTDTYIEKETDINSEIDKLRLAATTNIMTRNDVIVVASVSCIYNIGSPVEYGNFVLSLEKGKKYSEKDIFTRLVELQYERSEFEFTRGTFRVRGNTIDIFPAYEDKALRLQFEGEYLINLAQIDPLDSTAIKNLEKYIVYPAKHYMMDNAKMRSAFADIRADLKKQVAKFKKERKLLEAERIKKRVNFDLEMIGEVGYINGIENYSRYFDGRLPGDPPFTLLDYFHHSYGNDFLVVIDESHMTVPQIGGMYNGDHARKEVLVNYGFRLPSAYDNRPLKFDEFMRRVPKTIYTSATPAKWELNISGKENIVEQLLRPTGIPDPEISVRPTQGQIRDLISEIEKNVGKGQRAIVTTLTKKMAEDLSSYLSEKGLKVHYLHSEVDTLDRSDLLDDLRSGKYDVLVGINLLREGLDLPEVSLVAILDADKEGFLRSETSLLQVMGRAARHIEGRVVMYGDLVTDSMRRAIDEVERRRKYQLKYNMEHGITARSIQKPIREKLIDRVRDNPEPLLYGIERKVVENLGNIDTDSLTPYDKKKLIGKLRRAMKDAARDLNFELAIKLRDMTKELEIAA